MCKEQIDVGNEKLSIRQSLGLCIIKMRLAAHWNGDFSDLRDVSSICKFIFYFCSTYSWLYGLRETCTEEL